MGLGTELSHYLTTTKWITTWICLLFALDFDNINGASGDISGGHGGGDDGGGGGGGSNYARIRTSGDGNSFGSGERVVLTYGW